MNVAYVRVSTAEQNEARQVEALRSHNIDKWFTEKNQRQEYASSTVAGHA